MLNRNMPQWLKWAMAAVGLLVAQSARADSVADFYHGKAISLIVSTTSGTSYDLMGRILATYLTKYIPGNPTIVVKNMPGADGVVAGNYLYAAAAKDGTIFAGLQGSVAFEPLLGTKQATYDPNKFNWLGSASQQTCVLIVRRGLPVKTLKDLESHQITMGTSSPNSNPAFYARLLNQVFGTKLKLVFGYPSLHVVLLALERGELDAQSCIFYSAVRSLRPAWLKGKDVRLLLQYGPVKEQAIANVPFGADLVVKPDDKTLMQAANAPLALGTPYVMPPGVPAERVAAMRKAMEDTFKDPGFLAAVQKSGLEANRPLSGEQVQALIESTYALSPKMLDRLRKLMQP